MNQVADAAALHGEHMIEAQGRADAGGVAALLGPAGGVFPAEAIADEDKAALARRPGDIGSDHRHVLRAGRDEDEVVGGFGPEEQQLSHR